MVIAKILKKGNINLHSVLSVLVKGNASLTNLSRLARQSMGDVRYAEAVGRYFDDERVAGNLEEVAARSGPGDSRDEGEGMEDSGLDDRDPETVSDQQKVEIEAEIEVGDFDLGGSLEEGEEEEEEEEKVVDLMGKFRSALREIYNVETARDRSIEKSKRVALIRDRSELIARFDPLRVVVPSMEEAQAMVEFSHTSQGGKRIHKPVMKAPRPGPGTSAPRASGSGGGSGAASSSSSALGAAAITVVKSDGGGANENEAGGSGGTSKRKPAVKSTSAPEVAGADEDLVHVVRVRAADFS